MKTLKITILPLIISLALLSCFAFTAKKKFKVTGLVTETSSPCGGARPPKHVAEEMQKPKPLANKKIIIRKGNTNSQKAKIVAEVTSDAEGKFEVSLPAGTYSFVGAEKTKLIIPKNDEHNTYNAECLKQNFAKPDGLLTVKEGENKIEINFHNPCFYKKPCVKYTGPMPQ